VQKAEKSDAKKEDSDKQKKGTEKRAAGKRKKRIHKRRNSSKIARTPPKKKWEGTNKRAVEKRRSKKKETWDTDEKKGGGGPRGGNTSQRPGVSQKSAKGKGPANRAPPGRDQKRQRKEGKRRYRKGNTTKHSGIQGTTAVLGDRAKGTYGRTGGVNEKKR